MLRRLGPTLRRCAGMGVWLCVAALISPVLAGSIGGPTTGSTVEPLPVTEVAAGVFVHTGIVEDWRGSNGGDVGNLGFIVGNRCVAVVDTGGSPKTGERLKAAIARVTAVPVCFVINTHVHPDHLLGNAAFAGASPPPDFIAHTKLAASLSARERYYRQALQREFGLDPAAVAIVYPTRAVAEPLTLDLGGRTLRLVPWPTAHTDNDLTVYDDQSRTLFLGDLLFVSHLPVLDGSLRGWLDVMAKLRDLDVAVAVPGHGAPSHAWPAALDAQQRYLQALLSETRAAIKARATIRETVERIAPPTQDAWQLVDMFHRRNVTTAYAELEWEE